MNPTYRKNPYFYPAKGDVLSLEQVELMRQPEWIDGELSDSRSWLVVDTSY